MAALLAEHILLYWVSGHHEVISEEHIAQDGVQVDEDDCKNGCKQDRLVVSCYTADDVAEGIILADNVK